MRTIHRVVLLTVLATFASALTACSDFDPDKLDVFGLNEKKKLPGERKEVFPGGVPGVTQGIPPEFVKGSQPPTEAAQAPASATEPDKKTAAVEPEPKPKPKPKRPPKPRTVSQPTQITVQPAPQQQPAPWPQAQQPAQQQSQAPWPAQGQTNTAEPWPSSPQPGTFSR
jgi:outer membrane biosynthesis protein TonB